MSDAVWRSPVDLPRDGMMIAIITREADGGIEANCLRFGEVDGVAAWLMGSQASLYTWAEGDDGKAFDASILGWCPLPQLAEWDAWR